jgi:hypothetical protein
MRHVVLVALLAGLVIGLLGSQAGATLSGTQTRIEKRTDAGTLAAGKAGYLILRCPRGFVATGGGYGTDLPAIVTLATSIHPRSYAVVAYNLLGTSDIVVQGKVICIQGTLDRSVKASGLVSTAGASSATASAGQNPLQAALSGARSQGYEVVRLGH